MLIRITLHFAATALAIGLGIASYAGLLFAAFCLVGDNPKTNDVAWIGPVFTLAAYFVPIVFLVGLNYLAHRICITVSREKKPGAPSLR